MSPKPRVSQGGPSEFSEGYARLGRVFKPGFFRFTRRHIRSNVSLTNSLFSFEDLTMRDDEAKKLFIPETIRVGFQNRQGTYTGKLAYVIYYDLKGKLRKETSWEGWRDKKIKPVEFKNEPTEGFVLNRGVGGARRSYGWNVRNEYIRVYDPRDFEFEISIANLLFILRECDCSRGKGLEGKFVYAWDGTELVLLPTTCQEFEVSKNFTQLQGKKLSAKELKPGCSYITKKQEVLVYVGRYDYHKIVSHRGYGPKDKAVERQHIFWDGKAFVPISSMTRFAGLHSDTEDSNFAELVDKYHKSPYGTKVVKLYLKPAPKSATDSYGEQFATEQDGSWYEYQSRFVYQNRTTEVETKVVDYIQMTSRYWFEGDVLNHEGRHATATNPNNLQSSHRSSYWSRTNESCKWVEPTKQVLWVELESGSKFPLRYGTIVEKKKNG